MFFWSLQDLVFFCVTYVLLKQTTPNQKQIFVVPAVIGPSVLRMAGPISADLRLGSTVLKKCRSGGESLATLHMRFDQPGDRTHNRLHR